MLIAAINSSTLENFGRLCSVLFIFIFVLFLTYAVTKWIAGYQQSQMSHKNLCVVETMKLTANKYIQIIEVGNVYLVIGVTKDHIEPLAELNRDQLADFSFEDQFRGNSDPGQSFSELLEKLKGHLPKK